MLDSAAAVGGCRSNRGECQMLRLPYLTGDENRCLNLKFEKRREELRRCLRKSSSEKVYEAKRKCNIGLACGLAIEAAITEIVGSERAKLDALDEVLAAAGKPWTAELANALKRHVADSLGAAEERLASMVQEGRYGLRQLPPGKRREAMLHARQALCIKRNELMLDLGIVEAQAALPSNDSISRGDTGLVRQTVSISNSPNANIIIAAGDVVNVSSKDVEGFQALLEQMRSALGNDGTVRGKTKANALRLVDRLSEELKGPQLRASAVLDCLEHIADIGSVSSLAYRLSSLLVNLGFLQLG